MKMYKQPIPRSTQELVDSILAEELAPYFQTMPIEPYLTDFEENSHGIAATLVNGPDRLRIKIRYDLPAESREFYLAALFRLGEAEMSRRDGLSQV